jgi:hypothetical protein
MPRLPGVAVVVVPLVVGCGAGASTPGTHVEAVSVHRSLGCAGWFQQIGHVVSAHLTLIGSVHTVTISATLLSGASASSLRTAVPPNTTRRTFRLPEVDGTVASAVATVTGASAVTATCLLGNPH